MGEPTTVALSAYPYDQTALGETAAGTAFLVQFDRCLANYRVKLGLDDLNHGQLDISLYEVNYGAEALDDEYHLGHLAQAAGIVFAQSDAGGEGWMPSTTIYAPGRKPFALTQDDYHGKPLLSEADITRLTRPGIDLPVTIATYFRLANMTVREWAQADAAGELARLLELLDLA